VLPIPCGLSSASVTDDERSAYVDIYGPFCRSCHVANGVNEWAPPTQHGQLRTLLDGGDVCNPLTGSVPAKMPNSKVAFDRFWSTHFGPAATGDFDYPLFLSQFASCSLDFFPNPIN
jgi:hypothetical protein